MVTVSPYGSRMLAVVIGFASAIVFGVSDFIGGFAARRVAAVRIVAVSAITGLVLLLLASAVVAAEWSASAMLWGAASGVASSMGLLLLYAALAIGPMSILSPLTAVIAAVLPVAVGAIGGERLGPLAYVGIALAVVAVPMLGLTKDRDAPRISTRGLAYSIGSGVLIGLVLVFLDRAPADSGVVPLLFNRLIGATILVGIVVVTSVIALRRGTPLTAGWRGGVWLAPICGVIDTTANTLILIALRSGELGITSVLVSLYPASTIVLAAVVLRERLATVQWAGLVLALVAAGVLALA